MPRNDWKPKEKDDIWICKLHFQETDIIWFSIDSNPRHKRKKVGGTWPDNKLKRPKLKSNVFPCGWPGAPAHLSKISSYRSTTCSSSEARRQIVDEREEFLRIEEERRDKYSSLEELDKKITGFLPEEMIKVVSNDHILFLRLAYSITEIKMYILRRFKYLHCDQRNYLLSRIEH